MSFLTTQATVVLIVYIVQTIAYEIFVLLFPLPNLTKVELFFAVLIPMLISTFMVVYGVQCMTSGNCNIYAWIITGIILAGFVSSVIGMIMFSIKGHNIMKNIQEVKTQTTKTTKPVEHFIDTPVLSVTFPQVQPLDSS